MFKSTQLLWRRLIARLPAGSVLALLIWELRIALRPAAQNQKIFGELASVIKVLFLWQLVVAAPIILQHFSPLPDAVFLKRATVMSAMMLPLFALVSVIAAAHALLRADQWQIYLSAPIPWSRVVFLRCLQAVLLMWLMTGAVLPLAHANALILLGYSTGLALYVKSLALHLMGGSVGLFLVAACVWVTGPQHARKVLAGFGLVFALACASLPLFVSPQKMGGDKSLGTGSNAHAASSDSAIHLSTDSAFGDWIAAGLLDQSAWTFGSLVLAGCLFWLASRAVSGAALALAQPAHGLQRKLSHGQAGVRFSTTAWAATARKEWRLVLRSSSEWFGLLANVILIIGMLRILLRDTPEAVVLGTNIVAITVSLSIRLMPVFISAEEAPTLLATAPVNRNRLLFHKVAAALVPLWAIVLLAAIVLGLRAGWAAAAVTGVLALLGTVSVAIVNICRPYTVVRKSFMQTGWPQGAKLADLLAQLFLELGWVLAAWAALSGYYWASLFVAALLLVPLWSYWQDRQSETVLGY